MTPLPLRLVALGAAALALAASAGPARASDAPPAPQVGLNAPVDPGDYVVAIGDELNVKVAGLPELWDTVRVRPDGKISLLLVDDVAAAGLTPAKLDELLTVLYARFYRDPQVSVIVRTFASLKVFVGGEVQSPGTIELTGELSALAAVLARGGFKNTAKKSNVVLVRRGDDGRPVSAQIDLDDVIRGKAQDPLLEPFDIVYVPMSAIARLDRFVDQHIRQLIPINANAGFSYLLTDGSTNAAAGSLTGP